MSSSTAFPVSATTNVFDIGKYRTTSTQVKPTKSCEKESEDPTCSLPIPLLIYSPADSGSFPVLLLFHGFLLTNSFYSQLMEHIASHGFIVVAPQFAQSLIPGLITSLNAQPEIDTAAKTTNWLYQYLVKFLPNPQVQPNFDKLAVSGHSRGGYDAFALALNKSTIPITPKFSALIGIDPVAGVQPTAVPIPIRLSPQVLTDTPDSFDLDGMGVLVIGSEYGKDGQFIIFIYTPPCAPEKVSHAEFYQECRKPAYHFEVRDYGHNDVLDCKTPGLLPNCVCKNGKSRCPMRKFVGGAVVAFLKAYLEGDDKDLVAIRDKSVEMPVELKTDEYKL